VIVVADTIIGQCKILNYVAEAHFSILVRSAGGQQRGPSNSTDSSRNVKSNE